MKTLINVILSAGFLLLASTLLGAEPSETPVKLSELPPSLQKAIQARLGQGQLGGILRVLDDGEVTYEVEMSKAGRTRGITLDAAGVLVEEEVFLAELPAAVQKAIH